MRETSPLLNLGLTPFENAMIFSETKTKDAILTTFQHWHSSASGACAAQKPPQWKMFVPLSHCPH